MTPAAGPHETGKAAEAHVGADDTPADSSCTWALEEFDSPSPARPTHRPAAAVVAPLPAPSAQRVNPATLATLAPPKLLVTPRASSSGLASLAELPPLPLGVRLAARASLPDPKVLPSGLGSVHSDKRRRVAAPPAGSAGPSSVASSRAGKSSLRAAGRSRDGKPGRRLRWTPGEVQRVVLVARPEASLLAEAKEDYRRNLQAISHLRRQHAHGTPAWSKCLSTPRPMRPHTAPEARPLAQGCRLLWAGDESPRRLGAEERMGYRDPWLHSCPYPMLAVSPPLTLTLT